MQTPIQYTFNLILKLFKVNMRNLMSKGLSRDCFLSELVSAKRSSSNDSSDLTALNKFALAKMAKKTVCASRPLKG